MGTFCAFKFLEYLDLKVDQNSTSTFFCTLPLIIACVKKIMTSAEKPVEKPCENVTPTFQNTLFEKWSNLWFLEAF